jgi:hypothetical protein
MAGSQYTAKFTADGSGYARNLNKMRGQTQKFGASIKSIMAGAFVFSGVSGIKSLMEEMDRIQKLSKRFNLPVEVVQRLGFAAEQGGSSLEIMAKGLAQANRAAQEAMKGLKTYQRGFEDLNINYEDFAKLNQEQQFMVIADAVKNGTDANKSMAASQVILGRAGLEMYAQLKDGAQGYRDVIEGLKTFTQEQVDAAAKANDTINKTSKAVKVFGANVTAFLIDSIKGIRAAGGQLAVESGGMADRFKSVWLASLTGVGNGTRQFKKEFEEMKDSLSGEAKSRIKLAFEEGMYGEELEAMMRERASKGMAEGIRTAIDITKGLIDAGTPAPEDEKVVKIDEKIEAERKRQAEATMKDKEKLASMDEEIARGLEEYAVIAAEEGKESLKAKEKELELLKLQTAQKALQRKIADDEDKKKQRYSDAFDKSAKETADIDAQIEAEKRGREEVGMTDEQILKRRRDELAQMQKDLMSGTFTSPEEAATAQLDIEQKKTEIENLESGLKADPQTSIISSSLASIGGGGGVASFGSDPILGENKKQTTVLEGIKQAIESQNRGEEVLNIPEL